jgi:hypothetical protein
MKHTRASCFDRYCESCNRADKAAAAKRAARHAANIRRTGCRCGFTGCSCAKWETTYREKFEDPGYYLRHRDRSKGSSLGGFLGPPESDSLPVGGTKETIKCTN